MAKPDRALIFGAVFVILLATAGLAFRVAFVSVIVGTAALAAAGGMAWWAWRRRRARLAGDRRDRLQGPGDRRS